MKTEQQGEEYNGLVFVHSCLFERIIHVFRVYSVWQKKKKTQHNESKRTQICSAWYTALIMNRVRNSSWSRIAFAFTFPFSFDVHFTSVKLYFPSSMRCFCRNFGMVFFSYGIKSDELLLGEIKRLHEFSESEYLHEHKKSNKTTEKNESHNEIMCSTYFWWTLLWQQLLVLLIFGSVSSFSGI